MTQSDLLWLLAEAYQSPLLSEDFAKPVSHWVERLERQRGTAPKLIQHCPFIGQKFGWFRDHAEQTEESVRIRYQATASVTGLS
ncbi:unnamed protein product [Amoebophrya sp. A25]|nr:unnamed protein product [Amoebophrya sp. A25]|eukprot:GSA25T00000244001.1